MSTQLDHIDLGLIQIALNELRQRYETAGGEYLQGRAVLVNDLIARLDKLPRPGWLGYELFPQEIKR